MGLFYRCKKIVKYSGTSIEIAGGKINAIVPVEVGGVKIKPQILQSVGSLLQMLDLLQFNACQQIQELKKLKGVAPEKIEELIFKQHEDFYKII